MVPHCIRQTVVMGVQDKYIVSIHYPLGGMRALLLHSSHWFSNCFDNWFSGYSFITMSCPHPKFWWSTSPLLLLSTTHQFPTHHYRGHQGEQKELKNPFCSWSKQN